MRILLVFITTFLSLTVFAKMYEASTFEIIPLNSPVKGSLAKFKLKLPAGFEVDKVKVKLTNANDLKKDQKNFGNAEVINNVLNVSVSKLPPGFYRLYVKVWDKKNKAEHDFKTMFHDHVRFVIDESVQVPMPNEKENNKTLQGIDSDNDGIRDDIQRVINETFSSKPNTKLAAKQLAIASQVSLLNSVDVDSTVLFMDQYSRALYCLLWISPSQNQTVKKLETLLLNTESRIRSSLQRDQFFHGYGKSTSVLAIEQNDPRSHSEKDYSPLCNFNAEKEE